MGRIHRLELINIYSLVIHNFESTAFINDKKKKEVEGTAGRHKKNVTKTATRKCTLIIRYNDEQ